MHVLLDNCMLLGLIKYLVAANNKVTEPVSAGLHDVVNGRLSSATEGAYNVPLTGDQNMAYQQNLTGRTLAIVASSTNHWPTIRQDPDKIVRAVNRAPAGSYRHVIYPKPPLRRRPFAIPQ
jgi:hypothetical protein